MDNKSLKILCLHGFRHNSQLLKKSMEQTIKKLSRFNIEFDFFDSPIKYSSTDNDETTNEIDYRQWWSATKENVLTLERFDTAEQSINNLKEKWESNKYDGLLGFSQGSTLVQIFAYQIQNKIIDTYEPKFLVIASTFPISDVGYKKYYQSQVIYKTLIMIGSRDTLVNMEQTLSLVKYFRNPVTIVHSGGHYFSTTSETYYLFKNFLQEIIQEMSGGDHNIKNYI